MVESKYGRNYRYEYKCADCKFFESETCGRGKCTSWERKVDPRLWGDVMYNSDHACKHFVQSKHPAKQYLRTRYDGAMQCPHCGRNFCWSANLRESYTMETIADYLPDRPLNQNIRVFKKVCNFCSYEFNFLWDKVTEQYRYFVNHKEVWHMVPEGFTGLEFKLCCIDTFHVIPTPKEIRFNGPATIIFWEDGTKTVVKHDGKGRKDKKLGVLYCYMKKLSGGGKAYSEVLNAIEASAN